MQFLKIGLAWWFNVGVQVFLCISGFLYGQKDIGETISFYNRRFSKILLPYYLVYILFSICEYLFANNLFVTNRFIKGLFLNSTVNGIEHLWFVPTILMCYLITPILQGYRDKYVKNKNTLMIYFIVGIIIGLLYYYFFNKFFNPAWIACYIMGYTLGINEKEKYIESYILLYSFGIVAFLGNGVQIYCTYITQIRFPIFNLFCNYNHVMLGIFLFMSTKTILNKCFQIGKYKRILNISDKFSYEMYLVHQIVILGPFTLMDTTKNLVINIVLVFVGMICLVVILRQLEKLVERVICKKIKVIIK